MHLTTFTDYSLRVLMYLSLKSPNRVTVGQISEFFNVSRNHVVKVVNNLAHLGLIHTARGKGGGMELLPAAWEVPMGDLVRQLEPDARVINCTARDGKVCSIAGMCNLSKALDDASERFHEELNRYRLVDVVRRRPQPKQPLFADLRP